MLLGCTSNYDICYFTVPQFISRYLDKLTSDMDFEEDKDKEVKTKYLLPIYLNL